MLCADAAGGTRVEDEALRRLLEDERGRAAAAERGRTRRLREQAAEESTLTGTLLDLAESGVAVSVRTTAGRPHHGVVMGVGRDFCVLRLGTGRWLYLATDALASVRAEAGVRPGDAGTRRDATDRTLAEVLGYLAPGLPRVTVCTGGDPEPVVGQLRSVGRDLVTIGLDGPRPAAAYVRLGAITEVAVDAT